METMKLALRWMVIGMAIVINADDALANSPCRLSSADLQAATGRTFNEGEVTITATGISMCVYTEKDKPKRRVTLEVSSDNAEKQFESKMRLLQLGKKSIVLPGVGDKAYFNGTAAGVLKGDTFFSLGQLRRSSEPELKPENVIALLSKTISE
ncbi:hypothetical protein [Permianibacter aggregans]|uniref:Uncharacterized protein n=1 Tax=Permianibacter aggregans TaxID=1510150 RepID=A0A4R6ULN1_9GAMM|nr:hypothetical protein [Permianibacter aggregans]TDQ44154.1 hypothetical protein EV696_12636 [Permianibacter aggregans]